MYLHFTAAPSFVQLSTIALSGSSSGPHLLVTGGVHGDEFEPMIAIRQLAARPELTGLRGRLTLVPVVNQPALARGHRVAQDGLDLARTCPGRPNGSITERVAYALSQLIRAADFYIDLHTGGTSLAVWPMTGYVLHPQPHVLEQQRQMARAFNLPVIWGTDPSLPGRSLSVARDAGVPAIYAEYLGSGAVSAAGIQAYVEGCLNVLGLLGMLDRPALPPCSPLIIEDPRPQSGHMQRCYPAPAAGCFEAEVELGQQVAAGQVLGTIVDSLGTERQVIKAEEAGYVLVLRTFAAVQLGDSLAVILPLAFSQGDQHA